MQKRLQCTSYTYLKNLENKLLLLDFFFIIKIENSVYTYVYSFFLCLKKMSAKIFFSYLFATS